MSNQTYNGWTNYATWRVNLEMFDGSEGTWTADSARDFVEDVIIDSTPDGIARDYALAFISDVNWHEIAAHYEAEQEDDETETEEN
jgi:hypothetical protein